MNIYRVLGDRVGTLEARDLAQQLFEWHDAMVKHQRAANHHGRGCPEGCPHEEARGLWSAAMEVFGDRAGDLRFLQKHGGAYPRQASAAAAMEVRAPELLENAAARIRQEHPDLVVSTKAREGTPREVTVQEAADWGADLIVLGSHGHGPVRQALLGSVATGVAADAVCAVEIIRAGRP